MNNNIPLCALPIGVKCRVTRLNSDGYTKRRMLDLGLTCGSIVEALHKSPSGDPVAYLIRGAVIAMRSDISSMIMVERI